MRRWAKFFAAAFVVLTTSSASTSLSIDDFYPFGLDVGDKPWRRTSDHEVTNYRHRDYAIWYQSIFKPAINASARSKQANNGFSYNQFAGTCAGNIVKS